MTNTPTPTITMTFTRTLTPTPGCGLAGAMVPFTESIDEIDDLLTLTGLRLLHERNR